MITFFSSSYRLFENWTCPFALQIFTYSIFTLISASLTLSHDTIHPIVLLWTIVFNTDPRVPSSPIALPINLCIENGECDGENRSHSIILFSYWIWIIVFKKELENTFADIFHHGIIAYCYKWTVKESKRTIGDPSDLNFLSDYSNPICWNINLMQILYLFIFLFWLPFFSFSFSIVSFSDHILLCDTANYHSPESCTQSHAINSFESKYTFVLNWTLYHCSRVMNFNRRSYHRFIFFQSQNPLLFLQLLRLSSHASAHKNVASLSANALWQRAYWDIVINWYVIAIII